MVSDVIPFRRVSSQRDWTNEELAELYRVEHALMQAQVALETDRGMTDEGDPWFVFCRPEGDVLVHIARMEGRYHLFSPALPHPLSGSSFSSLTQSFVNTIPVPAPLRHDRSARVVMHPAAMLSILVVTIFFSADLITGHSAQASELLSAEDALMPESDDLLVDAQALDTSKSTLKEAFLKTVSALAETRADSNVVQNSTYLALVAAVAGFTATLNGGEFVAKSVLEGETQKSELGSKEHGAERDGDATLTGDRPEPARHHPSDPGRNIDPGLNSDLRVYTPYAGWSPQSHVFDDTFAHELVVKTFEIADPVPDTPGAEVADHTSAKMTSPASFAGADQAPLPSGEHRSVHTAAAPPQTSNDGEGEAKIESVGAMQPPMDDAKAKAPSAAGMSTSGKGIDISPDHGTTAGPAPVTRAEHDGGPAPALDATPPATDPVPVEPGPIPEDVITAAVDTLVATIKSQVHRGSVDYDHLLTFISSAPQNGSEMASEMLSWNDKTVLWHFQNGGLDRTEIKPFDSQAKLLVDAFLKTAQDAEFLVKGNCILIGEDPDTVSGVHGAFQTWALDDGTLIALVGQVNQPDPAL
jgi:hypothetical protein